MVTTNTTPVVTTTSACSDVPKLNETPLCWAQRLEGPYGINISVQHESGTDWLQRHAQGGEMTDFILYLDRSVVRDGKLAELKLAMAELVDFVEANEPEILAYNVYFSADGDQMIVMHMHADQASLEFHMEVAGPKFPPIGEFIELESIDVYGQLSEDLIRQLRDKASELGSGRVSVHELHRGVDPITDN